LSEPPNCREYVALHHQLDVDRSDRLVDVACGAGLAIELARARGATCAGIDASHRLVAVARDRNPGSDIQVGDMHDLPWDDATFDVATSFRGIWGTTPAALAEIRRVLVPGGRLGLTVWGHIKISPGAWALAPFTMATREKVDHQATMVSLGRPGAGEQLLASYGFDDVERVDVPFVWEFADPEVYARALASTGPAFEAIQNVGEEAFIEAAINHALPLVREGLPLRAPIALVGYLARKPQEAA
jgi:SAM-dependent methyltransferase